jgi:chromosome segregation ATPase
MQKELNPELFGTAATTQSATSGRFHENDPKSSQRQTLQLEEKIAEIRSQVKFALDQMTSLVTQVNEYIKSSQMRFDRLHTSIKQVADEDKAGHLDIGQRLSNVHQRLNERKSMDAKVQEMIDRHNGVLRSYEVRMNHLQKLLAEKDAQVMNAQNTINEAKMEIARLKRF